MLVGSRCLKVWACLMQLARHKCKSHQADQTYAAALIMQGQIAKQKGIYLPRPHDQP